MIRTQISNRSCLSAGINHDRQIHDCDKWAGRRLAEVFGGADPVIKVYHSPAVTSDIASEQMQGKAVEFALRAGRSDLVGSKAQVPTPYSREPQPSHTDDEWLSFEGFMLNDLADPLD